jgi:plasmid stability protein
MSDDESQLQDLYAWIDAIPLSRRKKNLPRDFSDGVLMAEVVAHFFPRLVELHNYDQGLKIETKVYNWKTLNNRVLKKLGYPLDPETIQALANSVPGIIERVLSELRQVMQAKLEQEQHPFNADEAAAALEVEIEEARTCTERSVLEAKVKEVQDKAAVIKDLEEKIERIEELIRMKDARIQQLAGRGRRGK